MTAATHPSAPPRLLTPAELGALYVAILARPVRTRAQREAEAEARAGSDQEKGDQLVAFSAATTQAQA